MKPGRPKMIHRQGLVAKVEYVPEPDNGLTGIYASGSDAVIMRISETETINALSKGSHPSIALKFLIDGMASTNIFGMESFRGT